MFGLLYRSFNELEEGVLQGQKLQVKENDINNYLTNIILIGFSYVELKILHILI